MADLSTASFYGGASANLTGPPGPQGDQGPQGSLGPPGPDGKDLATILYEALLIPENTPAALVAYLSSLVADVLLPVTPLLGAGPFALSTPQRGRRVLVSNGSTATTIQVILPKNAPVGTVYLPRQAGVARLRFVPEAGAPAIVNRLGHNATAGQGSAVSLTCESNNDGSSAVYYLDGDTEFLA